MEAMGSTGYHLSISYEKTGRSAKMLMLYLAWFWTSNQSIISSKETN